eukprot:TRINITY_DN532_c1_g1_i1.p1 TRINITY_DN532_c1_g1~~TRINITY_DN532_c1_g1_i1.p1  ORF type:complete len:562 (+),score=119.03 TRINITY_DN532_c1_g1_i1:27-1712(+)
MSLLNCLDQDIWSLVYTYLEGCVNDSESLVTVFENTKHLGLVSTQFRQLWLKLSSVVCLPSNWKDSDILDWFKDRKAPLLVHFNSLPSPIVLEKFNKQFYLSITVNVSRTSRANYEELIGYLANLDLSGLRLVTNLKWFPSELFKLLRAISSKKISHLELSCPPHLLEGDNAIPQLDWINLSNSLLSSLSETPELVHLPEGLTTLKTFLLEGVCFCNISSSLRKLKLVNWNKHNCAMMLTTSPNLANDGLVGGGGIGIGIGGFGGVAGVGGNRPEVSSFNTFENLRELVLEKVNIRKANVNNLISSRLETLQINSCDFTLSDLVFLTRATNLKKLVITECPVPLGRVLVNNYVESLTHIEHVEIDVYKDSNLSLCEENPVEYEKFKYMKNLKNLKLWLNRIDRSTLFRIFSSLPASIDTFTVYCPPYSIHRGSCLVDQPFSIKETQQFLREVKNFPNIVFEGYASPFSSIVLALKEMEAPPPPPPFTTSITSNTTTTTTTTTSSPLYIQQSPHTAENVHQQPHQQQQKLSHHQQQNSSRKSFLRLRAMNLDIPKGCHLIVD